MAKKALISASTQKTLAQLNYLYLLLMMIVIAGILTAAMTMQYRYSELPCPLCLLQRVALFGVAFGIMQNFRGGFSYQNTGFSLMFTIFLLVVSIRQTLLDIYPRPGHEYIGSAVFGVHMPVWSIIIAATILVAYAAKMCVLGGDEYLQKASIGKFPALRRAANTVGALLIVLCVINLVSAFVQCGFGQCHTDSYKLLRNAG